MDLFDYAKSKEAKDAGMALAASHAVDKLAIARSIAVQIATNGDGTCTADQVGKVLKAQSIKIGPWAGSIFKDGNWQFTGNRILSKRISNHAREIKVWRYEPQ